MIYLCIGVGIGIVLAIYLLWHSENSCRFEASSAVIGICIAVGCAIGLVWISIFGFNWVAAGHKAEIINREFGTHYTRSEVMYAEDVLDEVRQIRRQRIEVNGTISMEKKSEKEK